jgi:drug/metabolite transporter (DMT)-like permease
VITAGAPTDAGTLARGAVNTGDVLAMSGAATWALFNLASRRVVTHLPAARINCLVYGIGSLALFGLGRGEHPWTQLQAVTAGTVGGLLTMAILSSVIAGQFFLFGVRTVGVGRTVVFVYFVPVVTALLSVSLLGEPFHLAQAAGGACVLAGVYWTTRAT